MLRMFLPFTILLPGALIAQDDWAGLNHFAAENAALGEPGRNEQRVVFIGDSITAGWSDAVPEFFADRPYIERGISGQTTTQMLVRFRSDVVDLDPAVVVILAGTNDIAGNMGPVSNETIQNNLASMIEIAAENEIRVVVSSILPTDGYPWAPDVEPAFRILAINRWLADYAEDNDHIYLDYYARMVNDQGGMIESYTSDGVHVTGEGYRVMQELAEEAIDEALGRKRARPGTLTFRPISGCTRTSNRRADPRCN